MPSEPLPESQATPLKAFISYSWTSDDHAQWVLDLAKRLEGDGLEIILDRWDLKPGQDQYQFMEQMVGDTTVRKVLMICDRRYAERANGRQGGVGDETQIITPKVYRETQQTKFLPVIAERDPDGNPYKPDYLTARIHIDLSDPLTFEQGYEDLIRDIAGKPLHVRPPRGKLPSFLQEEGGKQLPTAYKLSTFRAALIANKPISAGLAEDYLDQLVKEMEQFNLQRCGAEGLSLTENIHRCLDAALPLRDEYIEFLILVSRYGTDPRLFSTLPSFFKKTLPFILSAVSYDASLDPGSYEAYRLFVPELFLYTVAALLKREQYEAVNDILARRYYDKSGQSSSRVLPGNYAMFEPYLPTLEEGPRPLSFSRPKPTAQFLRARATRADITASDLVNADYVLYVRGLLNPEPSDAYSGSWTPRLHLYFNENGPMPFFMDAQSRNVFGRAKVVLNVQDKHDLLQKFEAAVAREDPSRRRLEQTPLSRERVLMGVDELDTL